MKIKYRIWDNQENKYFQPTYRAYEGELEDLSISMSGDILRRNTEHCCEHESKFPNRYETELYSGLKDNNGKEIYEGDILMYRRPYRTTQTHTGDNIPNGSYTEPMEPAIETLKEEVFFKDGIFGTMEHNDIVPLSWILPCYDEEAIKSSIAIGKPGWDIWNDPDDGDLQYLLDEYAINGLDELIDYCNCFEVIRNIHEHSELIKD